MKSIILLGIFFLLFLTSCHFHTFRNYSINDQFEIKRKFADKDRTKISKYSVSSQTKRYYLPRVICEDSVKLREISTKVFKSNHKEFLHNYFDNCKLLKMNDTLEKFDYDYRIIHGTDEMFFDRRKCMIIYHKASTGKF